MTAIDITVIRVHLLHRVTLWKHGGTLYKKNKAGKLSTKNKIMSYFDLFLYSDSPRRIYDALPLSLKKRGGKAARGLRGESKKYDIKLYTLLRNGQIPALAEIIRCLG